HGTRGTCGQRGAEVRTEAGGMCPPSGREWAIERPVVFCVHSAVACCPQHRVAWKPPPNPHRLHPSIPHPSVTPTIVVAMSAGGRIFLHFPPIGVYFIFALHALRSAAGAVHDR